MQSNFSVLVFEGFWSWPLVRVFGISDIASKSSKWMQNQEYLDKKRRNENLKKKKGMEKVEDYLDKYKQINFDKVKIQV